MDTVNFILKNSESFSASRLSLQLKSIRNDTLPFLLIRQLQLWTISAIHSACLSPVASCCNFIRLEFTFHSASRLIVQKRPFGTPAARRFPVTSRWLRGTQLAPSATVSSETKSIIVILPSFALMDRWRHKRRQMIGAITCVTWSWSSSSHH